MFYQINNNDNKWLSLRGNKINKRCNSYFNTKEINNNVKKIINTEFIVEFNLKTISDLDFPTTTKEQFKNHVRWFIV